jgi:hypothetical protein
MSNSTPSQKPASILLIAGLVYSWILKMETAHTALQIVFLKYVHGFSSGFSTKSFSSLSACSVSEGKESLLHALLGFALHQKLTM